MQTKQENKRTWRFHGWPFLQTIGTTWCQTSTDAGGRGSFLANDVRFVHRAREPSPRLNLRTVLIVPPDQFLCCGRYIILALEANPLSDFFRLRFLEETPASGVDWCISEDTRTAGFDLLPAAKYHQHHATPTSHHVRNRLGQKTLPGRPTAAAKLLFAAETNRIGAFPAGWTAGWPTIGASALPTKAIIIAEFDRSGIVRGLPTSTSHALPATRRVFDRNRQTSSAKTALSSRRQTGVARSFLMERLAHRKRSAVAFNCFVAFD